MNQVMGLKHAYQVLRNACKNMTQYVSYTAIEEKCYPGSVNVADTSVIALCKVERITQRIKNEHAI